jgi:hypothetical protein
MTHEELDQIETNLRKVERLLPGDYGLVTALELAAELRKLLPKPLESESLLNDSHQSQSPALAAPV